MGMYDYYKPTYSYLINSGTGYYIIFANLAVLWKSKLYMDTALLKMDGKVIELEHNFRKLFLIMAIAAYLSESVVIPMVEIKTNV